jgi:hypothetical protein
VVELEAQRDAVVLALLRLGLSWDDWPEVVVTRDAVDESWLSGVSWAGFLPVQIRCDVSRDHISTDPVKPLTRTSVRIE